MYTSLKCKFLINIFVYMFPIIKQLQTCVISKMHLFIFLCVLFTASAQSVNSTVPIKEHHLKTKQPALAVNDVSNKKNLTLVSEGGTLQADTLDISLTKQQPNSLFSLDEEVSKEREKAVVPRKGAPGLPDTDQNISQLSKDSDVLIQNKQNETKIPSTGIAASKNNHTVISANKTSVESIKVNSTALPKKPMILSFEKLDNMEKSIKIEQSKMPVVPSKITLASSQIPSPNEDSKIKVYPSKANSHPGMIMPIVITILVVPMFAIVGYMALKRGQEAWKNRHYKRMDFLLDGMYND